VHKFSFFALCIIDKITPLVNFQVQQYFFALCSITRQSLYNLFLFFSLFFFKSYYFISLNQVISHSIFNKLLKKKVLKYILQIEESALIDILNKIKKYNINIKINLF
jgi:hypothetical protein